MYQFIYFLIESFMDLVKKLNAQVDKLTHDYELLKFENDSLKMKLENSKNNNDEIMRNNQDMLLKIDSTLTLAKAFSEEETDVPHK